MIDRIRWRSHWVIKDICDIFSYVGSKVLGRDGTLAIPPVDGKPRVPVSDIVGAPKHDDMHICNCATTEHPRSKYR
jgi:hypothetical protein